jgi:hydroxypyruvate isomerase
MQRRSFLVGAGSAAVGLGATNAGHAAGATPKAPGRLHQSVCRWPFEDIPLDDFCREARAMGLEAIDLQWAVAHSHDLAVSMGYASRRMLGSAS